MSGVVAAGLAAQWVAWRIKLPAILLLLGAGFALGRVAVPTEFVPLELLAPAVSLAVAVVLFEGGLSLKFHELREAGGAALGLITIGCVLTWVLATLAGRAFVFDTWALATLAGAIFTVTGPTVIGPLLRTIRPGGRVGAVAKWEGIVIDPVGALLAVLVFQAIIGGPQGAVLETALSIGKILLVGAVMGVGVGFLITLLFSRHWVPDYLQIPVMLAVVLLGFAASHQIQHESGLVTVTVLGIVLANQRRFPVEQIVEFKEALGTLLISVLFVVLAGRLNPREIAGLGWGGAAFIAVLVLVVRPAAVFLGTLWTPLDHRERSFLAWLAPRGIVAAAVASVFALELDHAAAEAIGAHGPGVARSGAVDTEGTRPGDPAGEERPNVEEDDGRAADRDEAEWRALAADSDKLVPLTFLVISVTVALYGLTAAPLARRLGIAEPDPQGVLFLGAAPVVRAIAAAVSEEGFKVTLVDSNRRNIADARLAGLSTRHGNALSETLQEHLNVTGLGRMLALTPNDEVNSLAATGFAHLFGRSECYQLAPHARDRTRGEGGADRAAGRVLFREDVTYAKLCDVFESGADVRTTRITEEFPFGDFLRLHGGRAIPLFVVSGSEGSRRLKINTADADLSPSAGSRLIALVPEERADDAAATSSGVGLNSELPGGRSDPACKT